MIQLFICNLIMYDLTQLQDFQLILYVTMTMPILWIWTMLMKFRIMIMILCVLYGIDGMTKGCFKTKC